MDRKINRICLFSNHNEKAKSIEEEVKRQLEEKGFSVVDKEYDMGLAIGGDGSFLRMVKQTGFLSHLYYAGINAGTLGFLQEIKIEEIADFVEKLKYNKFKVDEVSIQETKVIAKNDSITYCSLNEFVVRDKYLNTTNLKVYVNDELLERFVGDGILISTSTGSTAYNLSFGGSIVYASLHTLQITPIAPLNNKSYRNLLNSVIVPENAKITLVPEKEKKDLLISVDGENEECNEVEKIEITVRNKKIKCLRMYDYDFTKIIQEKFLK